MLECIETETAAEVRQSVIWLHGLGADGHDFEPIPPVLRLGEHPTRFVFPHAPVRAVTINAGMRMRAWYDIAGLELADKQDARGIEESARLVTELIARENERGIPSERVFLAGFSQGGAIALHLGVRYQARLAGIVALSTYLPLIDRVAAERSDANAETPVLLGHGVQDPMVPVGLGEATRDFLVSLGYRVSWHTYPIPHSVSAEELEDVRGFLLKNGTGS